MARRPDYVKDDIYDQHLAGNSKRFNSNRAASRQAIIERMYMRVLTELAVNRFKWSGMPDSIDPRFLEMTLFYNALSVFYWEPDFNRFLAVQATGNGQWNMLNNPTQYQLYGNAFINKSISAKDCVPIWANYLRVPDLDIVMIYSQRLAEIDMTIEINTKSARRTKVVIANENQRLTAANVNRQIDEGQSTVYLNQALGDLISNVDLGVHPDMLVNLHIFKTRIWNECMGLLGIDNANQDKKERLVAAEIDANDDQVNSHRNISLNARKQAAYKINKMYGLKVDISYNEAIDGQLSSQAGMPTPREIES